jgi:hypothetical protein
MDAVELVRTPVPRAPKGKAAARPVPQRNGDYAHLTLESLRSYRKALNAEEGKVSYWRRIIQARLDVLREGRTTGRGGTLDADHLRPVLTDERVSSGRAVLVEVLDHDDIPPLPNLAELWDRRVVPGDSAAEAELDRDLSAAERQLSEYRAALHRRIGDATQELIARYREQPSLCLSALPLEPERRAV